MGFWFNALNKVCGLHRLTIKYFNVLGLQHKQESPPCTPWCISQAAVLEPWRRIMARTFSVNIMSQ